MLLGQQFGWRHQRDLALAADRTGRRRRRDHRFSAANVALHQAHHRPLAAQVGVDFIEGAALRCGQPERQAGEKPRGQRARIRQRPGRLGLYSRLDLAQRQLVS